MIPSCFHALFAACRRARREFFYFFVGIGIDASRQNITQLLTTRHAGTTRCASGASLFVDLRQSKPGAFVAEFCGDITSH